MALVSVLVATTPSIVRVQTPVQRVGMSAQSTSNESRDKRIAAAFRGLREAGWIDDQLSKRAGDLIVGAGRTISEAPDEPTAWQATIRSVCSMPLVAIGYVGAPTSGMIDDGSGVFTTRPFLVDQIVSNLVAPTLRAGSTVTALYRGGTIERDGRRVSFGVQNGDLTTGGQYLLIFDGYLTGTDVFIAHPIGFKLSSGPPIAMSGGFEQVRGMSQTALVGVFNEAAARMPPSCTIAKGGK